MSSTLVPVLSVWLFRGKPPDHEKDHEKNMSPRKTKPGEQKDVLIVDLLDGRTISVPLVWFPRLLSATPEQRANWRVAGGGFGIHWPDVDEDLSTEGLLRGAPAPRGSAPTGRAAEG